MIELIRKTYKSYSVFINYCLIGSSGVAIDFVIFSVLVHIFLVYYQLANFISISCGITNNFMLNAYFNFRMTDNIIIRMLNFYLVGMLGWLLSAIILFMLIEWLNFQAILAKLIVIFVVSLIQFKLNIVFTFHDRA